MYYVRQYKLPGVTAVGPKLPLPYDVGIGTVNNTKQQM